MRQGYHAFRPSKSSVTKDLHLSANPVKGAHGAGLLSAEEMTSKQAINANPTIPATPQPTPQATGDSLLSSSGASKAQEYKHPFSNKFGFLTSKTGKMYKPKRKLTHEEFRAFMKKGIIPQDEKGISRYSGLY